jgi:hypothetical protein
MVGMKGDGQQQRARGVQKRSGKIEEMSVNVIDELAVAVDQSHQQP